MIALQQAETLFIQTRCVKVANAMTVRCVISPASKKTRIQMVTMKAVFPYVVMTATSRDLKNLLHLKKERRDDNVIQQQHDKQRSSVT